MAEGRAGGGRALSATRILRLATGGDGVGKLDDGRTVFVPRTAAGDLVELRDITLHRRFARSRAGSLVESGPGRVEPRCPHYIRDECGGCQLQHLDIETQRSARRAFVGDAVRRLARRQVDDPPLEPATQSFDYRTKITLAVAPDGRRIGLRKYDRPAEVFELEHCHITRPDLMSLWGATRTVRHLLPRKLDGLVLRRDRLGGLHLLVRSADSDAWTGGVRLHAALRGRGVESTLWWQPPGGAERAVAGAAETYPATVFEQVHPEMGARARAFALHQLGNVRDRRVWDLYAGVGETTAALATAGAAVDSVEVDRRAVAAAERDGPAATRHVGRVEDLVGRLPAPELVITNPPRTGMDAKVCAVLERTRPERIAYISCDPSTLARDLTRLPGYRLVVLRAFDLFPQTAHVESVAMLELDR